MKKILCCFLMLLSFAAPAWAQAYDIKAMTPQVKAALEARKARFADIKAMKAKGRGGENNRGYLQAFGNDAGVMGLVDAENADRRAVYQAIVEQNALGDGVLATVEGVFAGVQRDKAVPGEKIQDVSGEWITK